MLLVRGADTRATDFCRLPEHHTIPMADGHVLHFAVPLPVARAIVLDLDDDVSNLAVREIEHFFDDGGVRLAAVPAMRNDAFIFGRYTKFPTVALEVPIEHMHEAIETIARSDVELMRQFLKSLLRSNVWQESPDKLS